MTSDTPTPHGSPFWRFSLGFYRRPGVGDACIALQDSCAVDVNLLLFLLWLAVSSRRLGVDEVKKLEACVHDWREIVIVALRRLRRRLKGTAPLVAPGPAEAFRNRIKAVELEAERLQQEALYELTNSMTFAEPHGSGVHAPAEAARENVAAYESALGRTFPAAPVEVLLGEFRAFAATAAPGRD